VVVAYIGRMFKLPFRKSGDPTTTSDAPFEPDDWRGSTRSQWTIPAVYFDSAGWRLSDATDTRMSWIGAFGGTMTLTKDEIAVWTAQNIDLDQARRNHRALAEERRGGLVSAEVVEMASGALALEVITKYHRGAGFSFEGRLFIDESPLTYSLVSAIDERETGSREAIVNSLRLQLGEVDLVALMSGPADPATGGRRIPGMQLDPYDAAYDNRATYSASDDDRLDNFLQTHPLAVVRSSLRRARA